MNTENTDTETKLVKTYWIEQGADSVANAIHDFNRFAASGYSHAELRNQYLVISERIQQLKQRLDDVLPKCEATLYDALLAEELEGYQAAIEPPKQ